MSLDEFPLTYKIKSENGDPFFTVVFFLSSSSVFASSPEKQAPLQSYVCSNYFEVDESDLAHCTAVVWVREGCALCWVRDGSGTWLSDREDQLSTQQPSVGWSPAVLLMSWCISSVQERERPVCLPLTYIWMSTDYLRSTGCVCERESQWVCE